jgi:hypothetical protein
VNEPLFFPSRYFSITRASSGLLLKSLITKIQQDYFGLV